MKKIGSRFQYLVILGCLLLLSLMLHFPRLFFISDESFRVTGQESLLVNFPKLCKWDCGFYHYLANQTDLPKSPHSAAFFPLFPLLLKAFHWLFPNSELGALSVATSNFLSLTAIAAIILLGTAIWNVNYETGKLPRFGRPALLLALAIAVYPHSQFSSYGYSEPLFLLLYSASLFFIFKGNWHIAAIFCGLTAVTRPQGLWILGAFLLVAGWSFIRTVLKSKTIFTRVSRNKIIDAALPLVIAILPFLVFLFWQQATFGSPVAFLKAQAGWGRHFDFVEGLRYNIPKFDQCRIFNLLALASAWSFARRKETSWKFLALVTLMMSEIPLFFGGTFSYPRFSALNLGVFIFLTELSKDRLWLIIALLIIAITRLDVEIHSWLTATDFVF